MFGRSNKHDEEETVHTVTTIQLSDELRQALTMLDNDIQVVQEFMGDITANQRAILMALHAEVVELVQTEGEDEIPFTRSGSGLGVRAFVEDPKPIILPNVPEPEQVYEDGRQRSSPFNRRPRHEQEAWMVQFLGENPGWHHAHSIARKFSGDEREYRYLRSAMSRTLKELFDAGRAERAEATERGSMYRYRLK